MFFFVFKFCKHILDLSPDWSVRRTDCSLTLFSSKKRFKSGIFLFGVVWHIWNIVAHVGMNAHRKSLLFFLISI